MIKPATNPDTHYVVEVTVKVRVIGHSEQEALLLAEDAIAVRPFRSIYVIPQDKSAKIIGINTKV